MRVYRGEKMKVEICLMEGGRVEAFEFEFMG